METTLRWSKRAHRSRLLVAQRVRMIEDDKRLRLEYPEKFAEFEKNMHSPSAAWQHFGWLMSIGVKEGINGERAQRRWFMKEQANKRFRDSKLRSYGYLFANPRKHLENKMFHEHKKALHYKRFVWKARVELKQWKIQEAESILIFGE